MQKKPIKTSHIKEKIQDLISLKKRFFKTISQNSNKLQTQLKRKVAKMLGPIEKEYEKISFTQPSEDQFEGINLSILPKYICYKAVLAKEKANLQFILTFVSLFFLFLFIKMGINISNLHDRLRLKEYILAPGVVDFTTVSPQSVTDEYVQNVVEDYALDFGNINANNVRKRFNLLSSFMSRKQKLKFDIDSKDWIKQVEDENISQLFTIIEKEIRTDEKGNFQSKVIGRVDLYSDDSYLGNENLIIQMTLKLAPPKDGQRWKLEIQDFGWEQLK